MTSVLGSPNKIASRASSVHEPAYNALMASRLQFIWSSVWSAMTRLRQEPGHQSAPNEPCSFCLRSIGEAGPLVFGTKNRFICKTCARRISKELGEIQDDGISEASCSFARHRSRWVWPVATGPTGATICHECADLAISILDQERSRRQKMKND